MMRLNSISALTIITFITINTLTYGQHNINDLTRSSIKATPKLYDLYALDVKNYYNLSHRPEFNSELKTRFFSKSSEYINLYNSMLRDKSEMFNYTYYILDHTAKIGKYALSCHCFPLNINHAYTSQKYLTPMRFSEKGNVLFLGSGKIQNGHFTTIYDEVAVFVNPLPVAIQNNSVVDDIFLMLKVPEQQALEMEDNSDLSVYYFFNPKSMKTSTYAYNVKTSMLSEKGTETFRVFIADDLRVVVADNTTGKIYYDKAYTPSGIFKLKGKSKGGGSVEMNRSNNLKASPSDEVELAVVEVDSSLVLKSKQITIAQEKASYTDSLVAAIKFDSDAENEIFTVVEKNPEFTGGVKAMYDWLNKNNKYLTSDISSIHGKIYTSFTVNKDGLITDVQILKGLSPDYDLEAIRLVKTMPRWKPGVQNGRNVGVRYNLPIIF